MEHEGNPLWVKIVFVIFIFAGSFYAGAMFRDREMKHNPVVIQEVLRHDRAKQFNRFRAAAAAVADSAHLEKGMNTTIYVYLVEMLGHPCPLPDEELRKQCRRLLQVAQAMEVQKGEKP